MSLTDSTIRVPPLALLVDSDADTREMYGEWLRFSGFRIVEARTAWEALEMVREQGPHVIAAGMALPGIDGCTLVSRLKADERTRRIPVIAITSYNDPVHLRRAWRAGCDAVFTKPCSPARLLAEMHLLLDPRYQSNGVTKAGARGCGPGRADLPWKAC